MNLPTQEAGVKAWTEGRRAALAYRTRKTCPYSDELLRTVWEQGWREGAILQARLHGKSQPTT